MQWKQHLIFREERALTTTPTTEWTRELHYKSGQNQGLDRIPKYKLYA